MDALTRIRQKKQRLAIGLMSGTSCDGIDVALCRISGSGTNTSIQILKEETFPYESTLRQRLMDVFEGKGNVETICRLNFDLGEAFASATLELLRQENVASESVDFIGSHGQTIFHAPPHSTLQIGEPDVICERTGILTVADFRTRDIAAGGQGAPLIAYVDYLLFQSPGKIRALQNLGGIGNVTLIDPDPAKVIAFDTGPANLLIDWVVSQMTKGLQSYDEGGILASQGMLHSELLKRLMSHPYFEKKIPKTTGREMFHGDYLKNILKDFPGLEWKNILTTVTHFTAESMRDQYQRFLPPLLNEIILSGGGVHNPFLRRLIEQCFPKIKITTLEVLGYSSDGKEAMAFALLANETICGNPNNLPSVTGAR
ncbi:MAG: anhydro-N-acetylmuramic acid kinase, partial [Planctomycetota bacterium]